MTASCRNSAEASRFSHFPLVPYHRALPRPKSPRGTDLALCCAANGQLSVVSGADFHSAKQSIWSCQNELGWRQRCQRPRAFDGFAHTDRPMAGSLFQSPSGPVEQVIRVVPVVHIYDTNDLDLVALPVLSQPSLVSGRLQSREKPFLTLANQGQLHGLHTCQVMVRSSTSIHKRSSFSQPSTLSGTVGVGRSKFNNLSHGAERAQNRRCPAG